jgi:hypothetical protein
MPEVELLTGPLSLQPYSAERTLLLLDVVGDLEIRVWAISLLAEREFAVVELAAALDRWISDTDPDAQLAFTSIDAEEDPLLSFVEREDGWYVDSPWQIRRQDRALSRSALLEAATAFVVAVETGA